MKGLKDLFSNIDLIYNLTVYRRELLLRMNQILKTQFLEPK